MSAYVSTGDLIARWWNYTRRGVLKVTKRTNFPAPVFAVNQGRVPVWRLSDIEAYEAAHQELVHAWAKERKMRWYGKLKAGAANHTDTAGGRKESDGTVPA